MEEDFYEGNPTAACATQHVVKKMEKLINTEVTVLMIVVIIHGRKDLP